MSNLDPAFTHDCDKCVFLGTIKRTETILVTEQVSSALTAQMPDFVSIADVNEVLGQKPPEIWDLYVCAKQPVNSLGPSIIARYGHNGSDNKSAPACYASKDPGLALGFKFANKAGLIPKRADARKTDQ